MASSLYLSDEGSFMEFKSEYDFAPIGIQCERFVRLLEARNKEGKGREDLVRKAIVGNTLLEVMPSRIRATDRPLMNIFGDIIGRDIEREVPGILGRINSTVYGRLDTFDPSPVPSVLDAVGEKALTNGVRWILKNTKYKLHLIGPPNNDIVVPSFFIDEDFFVMDFMASRQFTRSHYIKESSN